MKKIYLLLLILTVFISISAVSAAENISDCDDVLYAGDVNDLTASKTDEIMTKTIENANSNVLASDNKNPVQIPSKVKTNDIKSTYGTKAKYNLKLFDQSGKIIAGKQVNFKIGKKVFKIKTDSNGVASLELNYAAGKYVIKYSVDGLSGKNTYTVSNAVSLKILKWGNKGDICKADLLKKNMPNNKWVKAAVKAAKKGNPLLKFEGGKGKKVFIISGVHGNELSSQVASMRMIKYLTDHPIKGTVYMIPFVNIKAISHKVRHTGVDYNRVAPKKGTISNKIVNLVVSYKCDSFCDLHTTDPGGLPGQNIAMGCKSPTPKSAELTNYIAKYAKVHKRIYKYAGQEYPTAFQDTLNKKGIPSVCCEVKLPMNTLTSKTIKTSFNMAMATLKFNSII